MLFNRYISFLVIFALPVVASAADHGGHSGSISDLIPFWVNFLLYVGILYYLLAKPSREAYTSRRNRISASVQQGAEEIRSAEANLRTIREKIASIDAETKKIRHDIAEEGERESRRILDEAQVRSTRIKTQAQALIRQEERSANEKLRREMADLITEKASEKIRSRNSAEKDRNIRDATISNVRNLIQ